MKHCYIHLLSVLCLSLCVPLPVHAQEDVISQAFCEKMSDEAAYDAKRLVNYKTLLQGKDNWIFRSNVSFKKDFLLEIQTQGYLKALQDGFKRHGTDFVLLLPPSRGLVHNDLIRDEDKVKFDFGRDSSIVAWNSYNETLNTLKEVGINIVGITDLDKSEPFYYKRDHHWSSAGARQSAQATAEFIKTLPVYADLTKTEFVTKRLEDNKYPGAFQKAFDKLCGTSLPPETVPEYETERKESATGDTDLFGDIAAGEVVLLGTSNSAPSPNVSNFDGFLKEYLSVDVDNLALAGAGTDTSIIAYINSEEFKTNPAKVAVWEVPGYYNINRMNAQIFMQAIPALYGDCGSDAIVSAENVELVEGTDLFGNIADKNIMGERYYLSLDISRPVKEPFKVSVAYESYTDTHKFRRSPRYPKPDGQFYLLMRLDHKGPIQSLTVHPHKAMIGEIVNAKICKIPIE